MNIKPIRTDADYRASLKEVEALMMAEPNTPEGEKLDVLVTLIEAYERKHFPLELPDPVEAIKFEMEQKNKMQLAKEIDAMLQSFILVDLNANDATDEDKKTSMRLST